MSTDGASGLWGRAMPTYRTDEQLEEFGRDFLRQLGLEYRPRPDPMTVIMKLKHATDGFGYRRVPDKDMPQAEAQWDSEKNVINMRESIFVGMQRGESHPCFVVFHEISHLALGHEGTRNRLADPALRQISGLQIKHEESEANRLAVILMAPEHLIPEDASAEEISSTFGLSITAAVIRTEEVDRIRRRRRGELRPLPDSVREILLEAKRQGMNIRTKLD
jgi:Zn-dependent peptidase ImmA (M78 family)